MYGISAKMVFKNKFKSPTTPIGINTIFERFTYKSNFILMEE